MEARSSRILRKPLLDATVLQAALVGLEQQCTEIEKKIATVRALIGARQNTATPRGKWSLRTAPMGHLGRKTRVNSHECRCILNTAFSRTGRISSFVLHRSGLHGFPSNSGSI